MPPTNIHKIKGQTSCGVARVRDHGVVHDNQNFGGRTFAATDMHVLAQGGF
ncbi:MAG: hypothetical protein HKN18_17870 [Silicimonas sp.]|nr:hypothetical protein [Silicimonas sp.]